MMNIPGIIGVILFYVVIFFVAIWTVRRKKDNDFTSNSINKFILSNRKIGAVVGTFSMTATWVSRIYINGTTELIYKRGLSSAQEPWCYALSLMLGGILFAKRSHVVGYVTMLDPLQERYGRIMGAVLYIPALSGELCWTAVVFAYLGSAIKIVLDVNMTYSVIVSAGVVGLYTCVGGLDAVTYTNILQLVCMFGGVCLAVPFAMANDHVSKLSTTKKLWVGKIQTAHLGSWIDSALILILGSIPWQLYFQRILSTKSPRTAQIVSFASAVGCLSFSIPAILIGALAKSTDWPSVIPTNSTVQLRDNFEVIPMVLHYLTPMWVSVIGLGAIAAAVMSSVDSSILSNSSMFSYNIYKLILRPKASSKEILYALRVGVIVATGISASMGLTVTCIHDLWLFSADLVYVILFPQLFCAVYLKFVNVYGSIAGFMTAVVLRICVGEPLFGIPPLIKYPLYDERDSVQNFPFRTFSMGCSFLILICVSIVTNRLLKENVRPSQDEIDIIRISYKEPVKDNTITSFSKISRFSGSYNNITASATELRAREDKLLLKSSIHKSNSQRYPTMYETN